jgi:RHS repeat-associated protein
MTKITNFVWNPVDDCIISELDGTGAVQAVYTNEPRQYGGVISQRRGTTSHYHHHDALGSTRFLTDSSGNVTDTYLNDAWGNNVASTGTTVNPFKWVGKYGYYTDDSTGQVYVRARMYQPTIARWCSVDPQGFIDGPNVFVYSNSIPTLRTDPSGESPGFMCPLTCGGTEIGTMFAMSPVTEYLDTNADGQDDLIRGGIRFEGVVNSEPPCCCESVKFIQVVRINYSAPGTEWPLNVPIFIDILKPHDPVTSPPFYPNPGGSGPGFPGWPQAPPGSMDDWPTKSVGVMEAIFKRVGKNPLVDDFETCVTCERSDGPFEVTHFVLQCMRWKMSYTRTKVAEPPGFEWSLEWTVPKCSGGPSVEFNDLISKWPHENGISIR